MSLFEWDYSAPTPSSLGDHDVPLLSEHLRGRRIALLVCGGIAAMRTPFIARSLRRRGADVVAFCSEEALRYVGRDALEWATCHPLVTALTWRAEHLSDMTPFDAYLVAPATYNTIGKAAYGIADTVITAALASAIGRMRHEQTQVLFAPTMHGSMHHEILTENARKLAELGVRFVSPRDEYGKHNLPDDEILVAAVCRSLSRSALRGRRLRVHADCTSLRQGVALVEELLLRGADAMLETPIDTPPPPRWLPWATTATLAQPEAPTTKPNLNAVNHPDAVAAVDALEAQFTSPHSNHRPAE